MDHSLAYEVVGLRLWEVARQGRWTHPPCWCFVGELFFEGKSADFSASFGPLERFRECRFRSPLDQSGIRVQPTGALCAAITTGRHSDDDKA